MAVVARRRTGYASALCLATDSVGDLVYVRGDKVGRDYVVGAADPTSGASMPAIGIIVEKHSSTYCTILLEGETSLYSSLTPGAAYVVGTDSRPAAPGDPNYPTFGALLQQVGVGGGSGELLVSMMDVLGATPGHRYYQQPLIPTVDPKTFLTWLPFKHGGVDTEVLLYNGQRLFEGAGNDYVASESGGAGMGYDTITLEFIPAPGSNWLIDYAPDL